MYLEIKILSFSAVPMCKQDPAHNNWCILVIWIQCKDFVKHVWELLSALWFNLPCVIPVGSNPALPPWKVKPWRSPAPCAATRSAAGNTSSRRGDRGSISDGINTVVQSWENLQNRWRKNIHGTNPPGKEALVSIGVAITGTATSEMMIHRRNQAIWRGVQLEMYEGAQNVPTHFRKFAAMICRVIQTQEGCA